MSSPSKPKNAPFRLFAGFLALFAFFLLLMGRYVDISDFTHKLTGSVAYPFRQLSASLSFSQLKGSVTDSSGNQGVGVPQTDAGGTLVVQVEPGNGWYEIINFSDDKILGAKTGSQTTLLPYGQYKLRFREISGYSPPPDRRFDLTAASPHARISGLYIQTDAAPIKMSRLTVSLNPNNNPLINGTNTLLAFSLTAENGDVQVKQLDFQVTADILPINYKLYNVLDGVKKEVPFTRNSADLPSFRLLRPEIISAGQAAPFLLEADIIFSGVIKPGAKAVSRLAADGIGSDAFSVSGLPLEQIIVKP